MSESKKYAIGSIVLGILSFYWETALFGLFLGIAGILFGYIAYKEAKINNQGTGMAIFGVFFSVFSTIYNIGFL
jgi:hypothetical protein